MELHLHQRILTRIGRLGKDASIEDPVSPMSKLASFFGPASRSEESQILLETSHPEIEAGHGPKEGQHHSKRHALWHQLIKSVSETCSRVLARYEPVADASIGHLEKCCSKTTVEDLEAEIL